MGCFIRSICLNSEGRTWRVGCTEYVYTLQRIYGDMHEIKGRWSLNHVLGERSKSPLLPSRTFSSTQPFIIVCYYSYTLIPLTLHSAPRSLYFLIDIFYVFFDSISFSSHSLFAAACKMWKKHTFSFKNSEVFAVSEFRNLSLEIDAVLITIFIFWLWGLQAWFVLIFSWSSLLQKMFLDDKSLFWKVEFQDGQAYVNCGELRKK